MKNRAGTLLYGDHVLHILEKKGRVWFVFEDVCRVLGLENPVELLEMMNGSEKETETFKTFDGPIEADIISESGVHSLVLKKDSGEAKSFWDWLKIESIPRVHRVWLGSTKRKQPGGELLSPTNLGSVLNISARKVNELLIQLGYQRMGIPPKKYLPTEKGKKWCKVFEKSVYWNEDPDKKCTYLKWYSSIVENLSRNIPA